MPSANCTIISTICDRGLKINPLLTKTSATGSNFITHNAVQR